MYIIGDSSVQLVFLLQIVYPVLHRLYICSIYISILACRPSLWLLDAIILAHCHHCPDSLIVFMCLWCPTQFQYHIMLVAFNSGTTGTTGGAGTGSLPEHSGIHPCFVVELCY